MFCTNCGNQIPDDSAFCPECGSKCEKTEEKKSVTIHFDFHEVLNYIISSIKNPVTTMKEKATSISNSVHIGIIAILTLLVPVIHVSTLKGFINSIIETVTSVASAYSMGMADLREIADMQQSINQCIDQFAPFSKLYLLDFFSTALYYAIIVGLIFVVYKFIFKAEIETKKFLGVLSVTAIINFLLVLIATATVFISFKISIAIHVINGILTAALLVLGMREVTKEENKLAYVVAISYGISFMITNYICINYVISVVKSYIFGMLPQMF